MEKIWQKSYVPSVPYDINPDQYHSILEIFEESCRKFPDSPAFYNLGKILTYKEIHHYSLAFAAYLQQVLKLQKNERIAIMLPNTLQYPIVMFGALLAGLTIVNVNPLYTTGELTTQLKDSGAETIVVLSNFARTVQKALPVSSLKNIIVTDLGDLFSFPKGLLIKIILKLKNKIPDWNIPQAISFKKILKEGQDCRFRPVEIAHQDIAFLQYTGGTTGVAKGAILTHRNIIANILQANAWFSPLLEEGKETIIAALPLYHIFSLMVALYIFKLGGQSILITNPRDIPGMIKELKKIRFTAFAGVNTLFNGLLKNPKFAEVDFSSLHLSLGGGMSVQEVVADQWQKVTNCVLLEAYGLTETSPAVTINPTNLKKFNGTIGLPISSTNVAILDEKGGELPVGAEGELAVKGPQVMLGYWKQPQETKKVFTENGWLLTGDMASINEGGYVKLLERKKDMIIVSGFNVYPNEVEAVLVKMPQVLEAAVVGVADGRSGEAVKAFIVKKKDSQLSKEEIVNFCHQYITHYKVPKYIEFRDELPKSNVGKILRRELRDAKN